MMKCPKCGEELEDGAAFCTNCGEKLTSVCPKCGKSLKPGAKFCSGCGANLAELAAEKEKPSVCPKCGAKLEPDEKFCSQCGTAVAVDTHAETTAERKEKPVLLLSSGIRQLFNLNDSPLQRSLDLERKNQDEEIQRRVDKSYCYENCTEEDKVDAIEWYKRGDYNYYTKRDYTEAVKWYKKSAEKGNIDAQYKLGECCYYGIGTIKDKIEAIEWYKESAKQGHGDAKYKLVDCYYYGIGTVKDKTEAFKWYKMQEEHHACEYHIGGRYRWSEGY